MPILRLTQQRLADGQFQIDVELERPNVARRTARGSFAFTLDQHEQAELAWYFERFLQYPLDPAPRQAAEVERRMSAVGQRLFRELFEASEDGRRIWAQIYEHLADLRVEVVTDVREATTIPWELLRDPSTAEPLALVAKIFVRSSPAAARAAYLPTPAAGPLRVLLVISRPAADEDVPFRSVASRLLSRLGPQAREYIALDVLRPPTFAALGQVLRAAKARGEPYHVLHFDGHGTYQEAGSFNSALDRSSYHDTRPGKHGYLLFEQPNDEKNSELISGPQIGKLLYETQVPVLVLNACRSAYADQTDEKAGQIAEADAHSQVRAYGSLAQEVMDAGVAGVIAMRYNVYVVTAAQYVAEFYAHLAGGQQVGAAATLARKHLADAPQRTIAYDPLPLQDWVVPVVYEAAPLQLTAERNANSLQALAGLSDAIGATNSRWEANALHLPNPAVTPDFCDPQSDGPLPGREENWSMVIDYRVRIALEERDIALAERLQQARIAWYRQRTAKLVAKPAAELNKVEHNQMRSLAAALHELGEIQRERGEASCIESYQESLRFSDQIGEYVGAAICAFNLGNAYINIAAIRDLDQAEAWYQGSLALLAEGDRLGRGKCTNNLGAVALERFEEALKKDDDQAVLLLHWETALNYYQQALQLLPSNAVNDLAVTNNQLGMIYDWAGDLERMRFHYDESIRLNEQVGNLYAVALTRENLALSYYNDGQYEPARRYAELALQNFARYGAGAAQEVAKVQGLLALIDAAGGRGDGAAL